MKRVKIRALLLSIVLAQAIVFWGCEKSEATEPEWRTDVKPITNRFPVLSTASNFIWKGEVATENKFSCVPGPSAYRIRCYIPSASEGLPWIKAMEDFESIPFPNEERPPSLDIANDQKSVVSPSLRRHVLGTRFGGQVYYIEALDVLYMNVFWE